MLVFSSIENLNGHARSWEGVPASHGAIRLGRSLALPDARKAVYVICRA
jgi:hypothetical protein